MSTSFCMKRLIDLIRAFVALAVIAVGSQLVVAQVKEEYPSLPEKLSTAEFETIDGKKFRLSDYKGKIIVLHLWATWNAPYKSLLPHLLELKLKYRDAGFEVIGLNVGDDEVVQEKRSVIKKFAKKNKINFLLGGISEESLKTFYEFTDFHAVPQAILLDRNGKVRGTLLGAGPTVNAKMMSTVEALIAET